MSAMKNQMQDANSANSHSFLLDDDATLPFSAADVLNAMDDKVWMGLAECVCVCVCVINH